VQNEDVYQKLSEFTSHVEWAVQLAVKVVVTDKISAGIAINVVAESRGIKKKIDSTRKELGEPAKKFLAKLKDIADGFTDKLEQIDQSISSKVEAWKKLESQAEMNKDQAAFFSEEFGVELNPYMPEDTSKIKSEGATAFEQTVQTFELEDISKVPMEYLCVDEKKVKLALKLGISSIAGLKIISETKTIIRSK
jgi:hypothetical protein